MGNGGLISIALTVNEQLNTLSVLVVFLSVLLNMTGLIL